MHEFVFFPSVHLQVMRLAFVPQILRTLRRFNRFMASESEASAIVKEKDEQVRSTFCLYVHFVLLYVFSPTL
jgi:hypothetical protein